MLDTDKERAAAEIRRASRPTNDRSSQAWNMFDAHGYAGLSDHLVIENDLMTRFLDYEEMDDFPELHTALDIYADDASQEDVLRNKSVWITSEDERVKAIGTELLHQTLRIEEDLWGIFRTLSKYGNAYAELLVSEGKGVIGLAFMPPATVRRMEDYKNGLMGFIQDPSGKGMSPEEFKKLLDGDGRLNKDAVSLDASGAMKLGQATEAGRHIVPFEDWEVIHWRLRGKWMRSIYGHSVLESARWVFRRLVLLEDAAMLYKLTRAPARYVYYIDTGDLNPKQALSYVNDVRRGHKKKKYVNAQGKLEFKVNPLAQDEDFWVPTRGGKESTRIDILSGADWQSMEDIKYFRQKILAAIKIPAAYIGMSDAGDEARASLSSQDVRFAKTILRIQREMKNGLRKVMRVHLSALGIDPSSVEWDIHMASPSSIFELAQIEVRNAQADLATRMEPFVDKNWILANIFDFSVDEIEDMKQAKKDDTEDDAMHQTEIQKQQSEMLGLNPDGSMPDEEGGATPPPVAKPKPPSAESGESSKEKGTGDKRPNPKKGKAKPIKKNTAESRLDALDRAMKARRARRLDLTEGEEAEVIRPVFRKRSGS